jgi:IS5 family transposase
MGTLDERSRPTAGRRSTGGECVRCTRKATSEEPDAWTHANTGESGAAAVAFEARAELELPHAGARSTNLVYRAFTRIGDEKVPDAKTLARLGQVIGPEVIGELHERLMELARERDVVQGRKMRVDTTVVETNIHYPTDSGLLGDGARVLTRTMQKVEKAAGGPKKRIRNRMRSVNEKVIAIALAGRLKGPEGEERRVERYRELVSLTRKIVHQAEGVLEEMQRLV